MGELTRRYGPTLDLGDLGLTAFWLLALVVLPYFLLFEYSFRPYLPVDKIGGPRGRLHPDQLRHLLQSPIHLDVFLQHGPVLSAFVTALCLVLGYPLAFYLAKVVAPEERADAVPAAAHPALGQRDPALLRLVHHPVLSGAAQRRSCVGHRPDRHARSAG